MASKLSCPPKSMIKLYIKLMNSIGRRNSNQKGIKIRSQSNCKLKMRKTRMVGRVIRGHPTNLIKYRSIRSRLIITICSIEGEEDLKERKIKRLSSSKPFSSNKCHRWISNSASMTAKEAREDQKAAKIRLKNTHIRSSMRQGLRLFHLVKEAKEDLRAARTK